MNHLRRQADRPELKDLAESIPLYANRSGPDMPGTYKWDEVYGYKHYYWTPDSVDCSFSVVLPVLGFEVSTKVLPQRMGKDEAAMGVSQMICIDLENDVLHFSKRCVACGMTTHAAGLRVITQATM